MDGTSAMHKRTILISAIALAAALAATLDAYVTHGSWSGNNTTMRASSVSFPAGSTYRTALGTVTSRYFNNPSNFWFTQAYDDASVGFDNGQNEVWFSSDAQYNPAVTFWWYTLFGALDEADVV